VGEVFQELALFHPLGFKRRGLSVEREREFVCVRERETAPF